jgi:predicted nucleic acid-binding protein
MKKLLLLDADVVIDLHSLGLFEKMSKSYDLFVTREVFEEAKYYKKRHQKIPINIKEKVVIIDDIQVEFLKEVRKEAREARLAIDTGESTAIAYILQSESDIALCLCDKAAIKLMAYMNLEQNGISMEKALKNAGHHTKLYPRHLESTYKACINEGKALRIMFKKLA